MVWLYFRTFSETFFCFNSSWLFPDQLQNAARCNKFSDAVVFKIWQRTLVAIYAADFLYFVLSAAYVYGPLEAVRLHAVCRTAQTIRQSIMYSNVTRERKHPSTWVVSSGNASRTSNVLRRLEGMFDVGQLSRSPTASHECRRMNAHRSGCCQTTVIPANSELRTHGIQQQQLFANVLPTTGYQVMSFSCARLRVARLLPS
jgi:hypothetical protein